MCKLYSTSPNYNNGNIHTFRQIIVYILLINRLIGYKRHAKSNFIYFANRIYLPFIGYLNSDKQICILNAICTKWIYECFVSTKLAFWGDKEWKEKWGCKISKVRSTDSSPGNSISSVELINVTRYKIMACKLPVARSSFHNKSVV